MMSSIYFQNHFYSIFAEFADKQFIFWNDIQNSSKLSKPYKNFFTNELQRYFAEIKNVLKSFSIFDTNSPEVNKLIEDFTFSLRENVKFNLNTFKDWLLSAIKLRLNFLSKPNSTLLYFIFGDSLTKTKSEILFLLGYFSDFEVILQHLNERISEFTTDAISVYEFYNILTQTEREYFNNSSIDDIISLLNPILEFFEYEEGFSEEAPTEVFADFFMDINLPHISNIIKAYAKENKSKTLHKETLKNLLQHTPEIFSRTTEKKENESKTITLPNFISFSILEPIAFGIPTEIPKVSKSLLDKIDTETTTLTAKKQEIDEIKDLLAKFDSKPNDVDNAIEEVLTSPTPSEETSVDFYTVPETAQFESDVNLTIPEEEITQTIIEETITTESSSQEEEIPARIDTSDSSSTDKDKAEFVDTVESVESNTDIAQEVEGHAEELVSPMVSDTHFASEEPRYPPFNELIDDTKKQKFIEELFYTMEEEYNNLVTNIDSAKNREEAMKYVDAYYQDFGIFPDMPIAKEFVEQVKKKFS
jgi:hypothetical protein